MSLELLPWELHGEAENVQNHGHRPNCPPAMHQTCEPPATAVTDVSLVSPDRRSDGASDSFGDDEASLVEVHKATPSSKLCERDPTRPTQPGNTSEDIHLLATCKQIHIRVEILKVELNEMHPALPTSQTVRNIENTLEKKHRYSPLMEPGSIRLLSLIPHKDESARIQCRLFDYPLQESSEGTHLYEALSYVWGASDKPHSISVDGCDLFITANLHAALFRLRDRFIERIVWIDAICINQGDDVAKAKQVLHMAEIYGKANRVIVWIGEAENDGDRALEQIHLAADEMSTEPIVSKPTKQAILALLQRPWFEHIWVLQEVAAARHILIKCGYMEIDGYAFCAALNSRSFDFIYDTSPHLQSLVRSVTYLVRGAVFRPKNVSKSLGRFSLDISPFGELIDMYHSRKATIRHDKVFALLGMSSDDLIAADLSPDYEIPWQKLFKRLIRFLLGEQATVRTWPETDVAVIKSKGFILGQVSLTERADRDDRQHVVITSKDPSEHLEPKRKWTLQPSAKPIQVGDLVCSLQGAAKPTIIRLCKDHFSVIRITAPPLQSEQPTINFPHEFLLLWDWEQSQGGLQDQEEYDMLVKSRVPKHSDTDLGCDLGKMTRLWNVGLILEYVERYKEAEERLREMMEGYESQVGEENLHTLVRKYKLALIYRKTKQWEEAKKLLEQVIQTRMQLQGTDHPDTNSSRADLASTYKDQGHLKGEKLEAMIGILERRGGNAQTTEKEVVEIARSFDEEVMRLLLDQRRGKVQITEDVVIAAAGNRWGGEIVMKLLLYQSSIDVPITEGAVVQIARLFSQETLRLLLDQRRNEVQITECVLIAAAEDWKTSENAMKLLLDWRWNEVQITEGVVTAAAGNRGQGERAMKLLLNWREKEARGFLRNQEGKGILVTAGAMTQIAICFDKEICDKAYKGERHATIECIK